MLTITEGARRAVYISDNNTLSEEKLWSILPRNDFSHKQTALKRTYENKKNEIIVTNTFIVGTIITEENHTADNSKSIFKILKFTSVKNKNLN